MSIGNTLHEQMFSNLFLGMFAAFFAITQDPLGILVIACDVYKTLIHMNLRTGVNYLEVIFK